MAALMNDDPFVIFTATLNAIPKGYYTSYGALAKSCGVHVRQVQAWLRRLPADTNLPWYRIMNAQRRISDHGGAAKQYKRLAAEGLYPLSSGQFPKDRYVQG